MLAVGLADSVDVADTVGDGDGDLRAAVFEACEPHALIRTRSSSAETPRILFTTVRIVGHYRPPPRPCPRGKSRDPDDIGSPASGAGRTRPPPPAPPPTPASANGYTTFRPQPSPSPLTRS